MKLHHLYYGLSALLILICAGGLAYVMQQNIYRIPLKQNFNDSQTSAVWDWKNPTAYTENELSETARLLRINQLNTTFVDISLYADIYTSNDNATQKAEKTRKLENAIERYVKAMNAENVRVFAAAGSTDWSMPAHRTKPLAIQQFVQKYNDNHAAKLAGLEFDIESYNQKGFPDASFTEKSLVLLEFLDTVDEIAQKHEEFIKNTNDTKFELGFAIPYWFDNQNGNIKSVSWHNKTGPVLYHLMDRLNTLPHSNVVVMAYRNGALGNDGMIYHSRTEIEYAQSLANNVRLLIGTEVTNVEPAKITFYGKSMTELSNEFSLVSEAFAHTGVLGGIAINDLEGLRDQSFFDDPGL